MIFLSGGPEDFCRQDDDSHPDLVSANKWVDTDYIKNTTDDLGGGSDIQENMNHSTQLLSRATVKHWEDLYFVPLTS